ncbi:MAG: hypothetical protein JW982_09515 [Spirochaetes bacterium]|nr:hypothetical protein [Spirochaetota bacterium]
MIKILFKKVFYESWDNFYKLLIINIPVAAVVLPSLYLVYAALSIPMFVIPLLVIITFLLNLYFGVVSGCANSMLHREQLDLKKYLSFFKISLIPAFVLTLISLFILCVFLLAIPFYVKIGGFPGFFASSIIFWASVLWLLSSQFYWPLYYLEKNKQKDILKKSIALLFDNKRLALLLAFIFIIYTAFSVFTGFLLPGISFVSYIQQCGVNMLLKKYSYLNTLSGKGQFPKKNIPWRIILEQDFLELENRTLKNVIFPWKD